MKLNVKKVQAWKGPGLLGDGGNLYLSSDGANRKSWVFIYMSPKTGKQRTMGLGPADATGVTLAEAREKATATRALLRQGLDPIEERKAEAERHKAAAQSIPTFGALADQFIANHRGAWRNPKHAEQWITTLRNHAASLRPKPVSEITTEDVLTVLQPLWQTVPETAARLRGRIENILDSAKVLGFRPTGGDVARWRGHLAHLLPKRQKLTRGHHRALAFKRVPEFMAALRALPDIGARLLEFTILTAARSGESRGAVWSEFDLNERTWTIPAQRMKAGKLHKVPLCDRALEILALMQTLRSDDCPYVFPSRANKPYSDAAMGKVLRRMGWLSETTCHGMRSALKDWCAEATSFPNEVSEMALAHAIGNDAEAAYRRGDLFAKRRELMDAWERYCGGGSNVVDLKRMVS